MAVPYSPSTPRPQGRNMPQYEIPDFADQLWSFEQTRAQNNALKAQNAATGNVLQNQNRQSAQSAEYQNSNTFGHWLQPRRLEGPMNIATQMARPQSTLVQNGVVKSQMG